MPGVRRGISSSVAARDARAGSGRARPSRGGAARRARGSAARGPRRRAGRARVAGGGRLAVERHARVVRPERVARPGRGAPLAGSDGERVGGDDARAVGRRARGDPRQVGVERLAAALRGGPRSTPAGASCGSAERANTGRLQHAQTNERLVSSDIRRLMRPAGPAGRGRPGACACSVLESSDEDAEEEAEEADGEEDPEDEAEESGSSSGPMGPMGLAGRARDVLLRGDHVVEGVLAVGSGRHVAFWEALAWEAWHGGFGLKSFALPEKVPRWETPFCGGEGNGTATASRRQGCARQHTGIGEGGHSTMPFPKKALGTGKNAKRNGVRDLSKARRSRSQPSGRRPAFCCRYGPRRALVPRNLWAVLGRRRLCRRGRSRSPAWTPLAAARAPRAPLPTVPSRRTASSSRRRAAPSTRSCAPRLARRDHPRWVARTRVAASRRSCGSSTSTRSPLNIGGHRAATEIGAATTEGSTNGGLAPTPPSPRTTRRLCAAEGCCFAGDYASVAAHEREGPLDGTCPMAPDVAASPRRDAQKRSPRVPRRVQQRVRKQGAGPVSAADDVLALALETLTSALVFGVPQVADACFASVEARMVAGDGDAVAVLARAEQHEAERGHGAAFRARLERCAAARILASTTTPRSLGASSTRGSPTRLRGAPPATGAGRRRLRRACRRSRSRTKGRRRRRDAPGAGRGRRRARTVRAVAEAALEDGAPEDVVSALGTPSTSKRRAQGWSAVCSGRSRSAWGARRLPGHGASRARGGGSLLHVAALTGRACPCALLLRRHAAKSTTSTTPADRGLHVAVDQGPRGPGSMLLEAGAAPNLQDVTGQRTLLEAAAASVGGRRRPCSSRGARANRQHAETARAARR